MLECQIISTFNYMKDGMERVWYQILIFVLGCSVLVVWFLRRMSVNLSVEVLFSFQV
jgi:hypothetical protein